MTLKLYNTLTRSKDIFTPIDPKCVRMYVCGPTVYDYAHIGNARPNIVFDVLFRLLRHTYRPERVVYVRNITDVEDKINARAAEEGISIRELTERTTRQFHADMAALGVLPPTHEPRATDHIEEMKALCEALVANGHAYVAEDHVLFHVPTMADYGRLSNRSLEEMQAGARVEVAPYKKDPMDFVLWKPSKPASSSEAIGQKKPSSSEAIGQKKPSSSEAIGQKTSEPGWPSPCGIEPHGRPGWHIECSAMADKWLWEEVKGSLSKKARGQPHRFDIHGGGIDLVFPHHENEIAQSRCAFGAPAMANIWMHNGYLQVEGEKMSKSLGNFVTIHELLETETLGRRRWPGEAFRLAMLMTHYRQPIDMTVERLRDAEKTLESWYQAMPDDAMVGTPIPEVVEALEDDLNTWEAVSALARTVKVLRDMGNENEIWADVKASAELLGVLSSNLSTWRAWQKERISISDADVEQRLADRLTARKAKNFQEADRIRDELLTLGVVLKDSKDPATGDIITAWEVVR